MLHAAKREGKPPDEMVLGQFLIRGLGFAYSGTLYRASDYLYPVLAILVDMSNEDQRKWAAG